MNDVNTAGAVINIRGPEMERGSRNFKRHRNHDEDQPYHHERRANRFSNGQFIYHKTALLAAVQESNAKEHDPC